MFDISGIRRTPTSVYASCEHAQNTGIYSVLASLQNIVHIDMVLAMMMKKMMITATMTITMAE